MSQAADLESRRRREAEAQEESARRAAAAAAPHSPVQQNVPSPTTARRMPEQTRTRRSNIPVSPTSPPQGAAAQQSETLTGASPLIQGHLRPFTPPRAPPPPPPPPPPAAAADAAAAAAAGQASEDSPEFFFLPL